jgi:hypothetical protein
MSLGKLGTSGDRVQVTRTRQAENRALCRVVNGGNKPVVVNLEFRWALATPGSNRVIHRLSDLTVDENFLGTPAIGTALTGSVFCKAVGTSGDPAGVESYSALTSRRLRSSARRTLTVDKLSHSPRVHQVPHVGAATKAASEVVMQEYHKSPEPELPLDRSNHRVYSLSVDAKD